MTKWKVARRKPEFVKFRDPEPIHSWSRYLKKGEWTLGESSGDFAIPEIDFIVMGETLPFAMKKKRFFKLYEEVANADKGNAK